MLRAFFVSTRMVTNYTLPEDFPMPLSAIASVVHGSWKSRGAAFGLCGGFVAPIFGSIVTVISWFIDPVWHHVSLHQVATTLFFVALPLLIFGAHCLDLLDREKNLVHASQQFESNDASAVEEGHNNGAERD